jgi:hypothetical protein
MFIIQLILLLCIFFVGGVIVGKSIEYRHIAKTIEKLTEDDNG